MNRDTFFIYNGVMQKFKIFITILLLYEFVVLTILQVPNYCTGIFNVNFCSVSFRYYLMCIMVPSLVALFVWWTPEISRIFCKKCQCEVPQSNHTKDTLKQDAEQLIIALITTGIQGFLANHPETQKVFKKISKSVSGKK